MLEDPIRAPKDGWTLETLMRATKEMFSRDAAYLGTSGGMLRGYNQRAVWNNDRKMMQTPLGLRNGAKGGQAAGGQGSGGQGDCTLCHGTGQRDAQCPIHVAKKDKAWLAKSSNARGMKCTKCGGSQHWAHHHRTPNTQRKVQESQDPLELQSLSPRRRKPSNLYLKRLSPKIRFASVGRNLVFARLPKTLASGTTLRTVKVRQRMARSPWSA